MAFQDMFQKLGSQNIAASRARWHVLFPGSYIRSSRVTFESVNMRLRLHRLKTRKAIERRRLDSGDCTFL